MSVNTQVTPGVDQSYANAASEFAHSNQSLLEHFKPNSSVYFSNKSQELLAQPPFASLLVSGMEGLPEQAKESLRFASSLGFKDAIVVGAIPFDVEKKGSLRVSTNVAVANKRQFDVSEIDIGRCEIQEYPEKNLFQNSVKSALERFAKGEVDKVVLSRTLNVICERQPCVKTLIKLLSKKNTSGYTFSVNLPNPVDDFQNPSQCLLVGASPELLVRKVGDKIYANPLAGSEPRSSDPEEDRIISEKLLGSEKDLREHALVVDAIKSVLAPFCKNMHVPEKPSLMNTATMWHLSTEIEAELLNPETSSLDLALAMHPTPAVCGYPRFAARQAISELEPYDRNMFTGIVGWCDGKGDGEWVVTIRCAEVEGKKIKLYAGAGIVPGSCPEKEYNETGAKFNTMLQALGV